MKSEGNQDQVWKGGLCDSTADSGFLIQLLTHYQCYEGL